MTESLPEEPFTTADKGARFPDYSLSDDRSGVKIPLTLVGAGGMVMESLYGVLSQRNFHVRPVVGGEEDVMRAAAELEAETCLVIDSPVGGHQSYVEVSNELALSGKKVIRLIDLGDYRGTRTENVTEVIVNELSVNGLAKIIRRVHAGQEVSSVIEQTLDPHRGIVPFKALSNREWACLLCLYDGKSGRQIALELNINYATTRTHITNMLRKLNLHSRLEAVALLDNFRNGSGL